MYARVSIVLFLAACSFHASSQGKIVLVGGGSEAQNGWSDAPYQWAVDQSNNRKVAVISYAVETAFIPEYFVSLGAVQADNIRIGSRAMADQQDMYDSLMKYDVFFFKGGDQSYYYRYFKGTKVVDAIHDKFIQGGVMAGTSAGMAILSGVIFTAENDSVYPDEALSDFKSRSITLADDFSQLLPGFIADSHFTERGRVARMLAFLANWNFKRGEWLTGIGVDDRTALCIDASEKAIVFGTGSVSFYRTKAMTAFQDDKPVADSVGVTQLLHGHIIQLPFLTIIEGPEDLIQPSPERVHGTYALILSGSDDLASNSGFLDEFIRYGSPTDSIIVVTATAKGVDYIAALEGRHLKFTVVETKATNNGDDQGALRDLIRQSKKMLLVDNDDNALFSFLEGGKTGVLIRQHMIRNNILSGFVGQDSRYAGKVFVTNHLADPYAAYYGGLRYEKGLGLLGSSIIMPDTYQASTTDFYENTTAAVSYAMINDSLRYGIYLNRNSYLMFGQDDMENYFESRGTHSAMILVNQGSYTTRASAPVNSSGDVRNYAGFSSMHYTLLNGPARLMAGHTSPAQDEPYQWETVIVSAADTGFESNFYPNPTRGIFYYDMGSADAPGQITIFDAFGRPVATVGKVDRSGSVDLSQLPDGVYFIRLSYDRRSRTAKIFIRH